MADPIIGRDVALAEVGRRLRGSRLVTITGPGGIGKTTVADAAAGVEAAGYELGARRVDLTLVDAGDDVGDEVAAALAAQLGFGSFRALIDSPTDRPALVVVDGCEHVLDAAAAALEQVLEACPAPTFLATSRSPLGVPGESVVVLPPLALPADDGDVSASPAVRLFLARARDGGATIPDEDLPTVGRLCTLLDGIPLAIELAAARSRVLTVHELLDRLGDLDTFRRRRSRGAARHRSLRDTIAWSYSLLEPDEQVCSDRLSVLSGAFTLDDAIAVDEGSHDTLDHLERLVADSLLASRSVSGVTMYRQLGVVRAFARERLEAAGGWDTVTASLVDHVTSRAVRLATDASAGWDGSSLATSFERLDQHLAALRWALDHDEDPERCMVLVATLWGPVHQGRLEEIAPLADRALARWDDPTASGWPDAAATAATCRYLLGRPAEAITLARRALPHAGGSPYAPCTLRRAVAHSLVAMGDLPGAVALLTEAIGIAEDRSPALAAEMTVSRAELAVTLTEGTPEEAARLEESLATVRGVAEDAGRSGAVVNGIWARSVEASLLARVDGSRAAAVAERALATAEAAGYPSAGSVDLHTLASVALAADDLLRAASLVRRLVDGLVARGAECELRNALRLAAAVLERAGDDRWDPLAATAASLPVVSLFSLPGHEVVPLPPTRADPLPLREAVTVARQGTDAIRAGAAGAGGGARPVPAPGRPRAKPPLASTAGTDDPDHDRGDAGTDDPDAGTDRAPPAAEWRCEGDTWRLLYAGTAVTMRATKGLLTIGRLLAAAGTEVHSLDLADAAVDEGHTGEVIDARARRAYEERVRELQAEVDEAEACSDLHRAERARTELDALVDHLTAALGLGGRARRGTGTSERARSAVTHRIRSTIRRLREVHPALADHLDRSIRTGTFCRYHPEHPVPWTVELPP